MSRKYGRVTSTETVEPLLSDIDTDSDLEAGAEASYIPPSKVGRLRSKSAGKKRMETSDDAKFQLRPMQATSSSYSGMHRNSSTSPPRVRHAAVEEEDEDEDDDNLDDLLQAPNATSSGKAVANGDEPSGEKSRGGKTLDEQELQRKLAKVEEKLEKLQLKKEKYLKRLRALDEKKEKVAGPISWSGEGKPGSGPGVASTSSAEPKGRPSKGVASSAPPPQSGPASQHECSMQATGSRSMGGKRA